MPLRFCMVTTFYPPYHFGGDAVFVRALSEALARRGHEVEVIYNEDAYRALAPANPTLGEPTPAPVDHPRVRRRPLRSRAPLLTSLAMHQTGHPLAHSGQLAYLLARDHDVIHFHNTSLAGGPTVLGFDGAGALKLYTAHEHWLVCQTHVMFSHRRAPCQRPRCWSCALAHGRPPQLWRHLGLIERGLRHLDALIAPSRFIADQHARITEQLGLPTEVLPSFCSLPTEAPRSTQPEAGGMPPYFLFVGRLERIKGLHTLLPVFERLQGARLLVAGGGSELASLRRQARGNPRVTFLGHVPHRQLPSLFREARALIIPSLCYEVLALVMVEAMSQGTPVIARRLGSVAETIEESQAGLTFGDDDELLGALRRLLDRPALARTLGEAGRRHAHATYAEELHLERYLALIERLRAER